MRQSTPVRFLLALLLISAGCSGYKSSGGKKEPDIGPDVETVNSPVDLYRASTELANALADVLAEIKDKDSASKAEPKLDLLNRKAKILAAKSKELPLDPQQQQRLEQQFKADTDKASRRIEEERRRIKANPELAKLLADMNLKQLLE